MDRRRNTRKSILVRSLVVLSRTQIESSASGHRVEISILEFLAAIGIYEFEGTGLNPFDPSKSINIDMVHDS